jgi:hypothetical protein
MIELSIDKGNTKSFSSWQAQQDRTQKAGRKKDRKRSKRGEEEQLRHRCTETTTDRRRVSSE